MADSKALDDLLDACSPAVQRLVVDARRYVRRWLPAASESVDIKARRIGYSYGPGYKGLVCTLILSKAGVKLGLVGGAALPDPHGLLEGSGKVHRHVPLSAPRDLRRPGVRELLLGASDACRARLVGRAP
jgi:hypothetical protein